MAVGRVNGSFSISSFRIRIWLYPERRSNFVKYVDPCTVSNRSSIFGKHALLLMVILFRSLQSHTIRKLPSAILTKKTAAPKGDLLGTTNLSLITAEVAASARPSQV